MKTFTVAQVTIHELIGILHGIRIVVVVVFGRNSRI